MVNEFAYAGGGDPHEALSRAHELVRRVRAAQRATWFPLLVFAAVTFGAIPVERYGGRHVGPCVTTPQAHAVAVGCVVYPAAIFIYWPIALVLAYVAIAAFYLRQSRARGLGTRVGPYIVAGIVIAAALTGASLWAANRLPLGTFDVLGLHVQASSSLPFRLASPACAIGLALLVLAWAERNLALLVFTVGYLVIVAAPVTFGWVFTHPTPWAPAPRLVISGGVLLLGAIGFALAQRPARLPAA
jgi:hypothetical protein